jgi:Cobalamin-5-phosphate synthase
MKDPRSGPIAVVTLGLVLLLKFTALVALIEQRNGVALILAPLIGRASMLGLFLTTRYVRAGGLGQALSGHLPRVVGQQVLILSGLACILFGGFSGGLAVLLAAVCFIGLRQLMVNRLGGTTGDTAGALLELLEVAVLVGLAL